MTAPAVSVIVPVYNDVVFLREALQSIADQTFADFEVVVSDDGSTDGSGAVAAEFAERDRRFRLIANRVNVGMTRNWNRALREATGRYLVKLDSDDAFRPRTLDLLVQSMDSDAQPVVAYCRTLDCDENLLPYASYLGEGAFIRARIDPLASHCRMGHDWYRLCFDDMQLWHSNAQMHRREVLLGMDGWDESWGCASDTDLILRVLERNEPVCHVPYVGVLYRHRPGSVSAVYRRNSWLKWESCMIHLGSIHRYYENGGRMFPSLKKAWWRHWLLWKKLQSGGKSDLDALPEDARERLLRQAALMAPLPVRIRLPGLFRQSAWDLLHSGRRTAAT